MHVRYKLRKPKGLITPKGPRFSNAKTIHCNIDGTVIQFKLPKHRPRLTNNKPVLPAHSYSLNEIIFHSSHQRELKVSNNWETFRLIENAWAFYGPWFTGSLSELIMYATLIKPVNYENNDFSLFHPRAFEKIIGDYLTNSFSTHTNEFMENKHEYIAPLNWKPLTKFPMVAVRLQVEPDIKVARGTIRYFVFLPITDKVMICIQFVPSQFLAMTQEELDKRVNRSSMLELMNNIIDSIELTLSPEAQAQQKAALTGLDDASLISDFPPLKWPVVNKENTFKELDNE